MNGLPKNFDFDALRGRTLDMVAFGRYKVNLHLSGSCLIGVEGTVSVNTGEALRLPDSLAALYPLIDTSIAKAFSESAGTLSLAFESGDVLNIHDSSARFESYSVQLDGREVAIV
jgi:hypothetical protein